MKQCFAGSTLEKLAEWCHDEDGAVTTDWVVLTAGIVTMAMVVFASVSGGVQVHAANTGAELSARTLGVG